MGKDRDLGAEKKVLEKHLKMGVLLQKLNDTLDATALRLGLF